MCTTQPAERKSPERWLADFLGRLRRDDLAPASVRGYHYDLQQFLRWFSQAKGSLSRLEKLSILDLINYRQHLVNIEALKPATVNRRLKALRRFCRWAEQNRLLKSNVALELKLVRTARSTRPLGLTEPEVHSLLRLAGESGHGLAKRNYALVQLMVQAGLRVSEVAALRIADITARECSGLVRIREGKGLKAREVPLNATARRALHLHLYLDSRSDASAEEPLFLSGRAGAMPTRTIQAVIAHLARRAKIDRVRVSAHTLRHTFALNYLRQSPASWWNWPACWATNPWPPPPTTHGPPARSWPKISKGAVSMLTADAITQGEVFATVSRVRSPRVLLPADPSEEELARDFSLSGADKKEIRRCRGDEHRRRFAVQLCVLRKTGRFLDSYRQVPTRILTHLSRQLDLSPVLFVSDTEQSATEYDYQERIRQYLGWQSFDQRAEDELTRWLEMRAAEGTLPADLLQQAEGLLRSWRVALPASSSLERLVASTAAQAQQAVFAHIAEHLSSALCKDLDTLLNVAPNDYRSALLHLKEYPPEASAGVILAYIARYQQVHDLVANRIDLGMINPGVVRHLALLTKRYDVHALKRFTPAKRHAMLACFLVEVERSLLDHLVEMHDQYLTTMWRRARHAFEQRHRQLRRRAREGVETVLLAIEILLASPADGEDVRAEVSQRVGFEHLHDAAQSCREFQRLEERGQLDELCARYTNLRRYLPAFFSLPFAGEKGAEELLVALLLLRRFDAGKIEDLPKNPPCHFVPAAWRPALYRDDGTVDRRVWVIAVSQAVRDALRGGDLYLPGSRHHVSFWNLVYDEQRWEAEQKTAYASLALPTEAETVLGKLWQEYTDAVGRAAGGLNENAFASVCDGRLQLKRADALEIPERTRQLRHAIETALPRVRIELLLQEVDRHCGFTCELRPIGGYEPRLSNLDQSQLAALIAHGTNLGIAAMGHRAEGITADMLQHVRRFFLTDATLKAVNAVVNNFHHRLGFSGLWGAGSGSSSDGQRFGIQASSLLASFYPRYFGYYERAITVYTHTSDHYSVFGTRAISCSAREALHVLDGLLENDSILRPYEHSTDTHGFTEQLFGLCYLLGYSFMPRLRDLADQQLYRLDSESPPESLRPLLRSGLDLLLLAEQWDQLVRVAASLRNRVASAHVVLQRLANASPADRVAKALTTLGRVVKTIYILRYIHEEELRRRVQIQLNRGESRHALARWLFFANRGEFRSGDYEEIMNKASCLSLLSNAVLVWNTMAIMKIVTQLRAAGETIEDEDLARISPLMHQHIIPNGTYHFARSKRGDDVT